MSGYQGARDRMVEEQIRVRGVRHPLVLKAMREIPRHVFVPTRLRSRAYDDRPVSIGMGQTISQPYMVALMTESLDPDPKGHVLEIGTGSGYQTAVLGHLFRQVDSIERIPELALTARGILASLSMTNVTIHVGDGTRGLQERAPFDAILVTAGSPGIPEPLVQQLKEGGRLIIPVGDAYHQTLYQIVREGHAIRKQAVIDCVFVPLIGAFGWEQQQSTGKQLSKETEKSEEEKEDGAD
jgi:protein-L-isoaspartate(D-aspartate) O-methyltransferase